MLVRFGAFLSYLLVGSVAAAQDANARIRAELEQIHTLDQRDRQNVGNYTTGAQKDSVIAHMIAQDSLDLLRVTAILDSAGWLGERRSATRRIKPCSW